MTFRLRILLLFVLCALVPRALAEETLAFRTDLRLSKDAVLSVTETIVEDFGADQRHGLYRTIPVKYERHGSTYGIAIKVVGATLDGKPTPVQTSTEWRDLKIRMGDPKQFISGKRTFRLSYTVRSAMNYFDGEPELYWNAIPTEWPFPIAQATVLLHPPAGVTTEQMKLKSFVGSFGSTVPARSSVTKAGVLFQAADLSPHEGLTIAARLPEGSVTTPTKDKVMAYFGGWFLAVLLPFLTLLGISTRWWKTGRDEDGGQPAGVEWEPPKGLTPAEVGTLMDERVDMEDIVSTLVDLAARGYLTIEVVETTKLFFFSSRDYIFTRRFPEPDMTVLKPHEKQFFDALFSMGSPVNLSTLKEKFYTNLSGIRSSIYQQLTTLGLFHGNPDTTRNAYYVLAVVLVVAAFAGFIVAQARMAPMWIGMGVSGIIVGLFAQAMPAKTALGSRALREARGFQRFVKMAEKRRIEMLAKDDPTIFGRLLPYAMVLGVGDQWAAAFQDLLKEPPDWYTGPYGVGHPFSSSVFINDLGSGMQTMGSTFSSSPSSAGSGGSGFSGGGSGGGFGGGGGGSW